MKLSNLVVAGAALAAGIAGGTATYVVAAQPSSSPASTPADATTADEPGAGPTLGPPQPVVRLAPCKPPAVREGKACVTEVVETVVLPPTVGQTGPAAAPASGHLQASGDHGEESEDHDGPGGHDATHDEDADHDDDGHGDDEQAEDHDEDQDDHGEEESEVEDD